MPHAAFVYGTLMAPPVLHRVIWGSSTPPTPAHASLLRTRPAVLHAHRRHKVKQADFPAVVPTEKEASSVRGILVEGLTDGDMWRLDIFEGSEYQRRKVRVDVLPLPHQAKQAERGIDLGHLTEKAEEGARVQGEQVEAETYIWIAGAHRLESEEWDFDEFVRDKMKRWVGREAADTDEGFQDVDDAIATQEDPTGGRGPNGDITRRLQGNDDVSKSDLNSAV